MGRPVVHWEFWSEDPAQMATFYRQVFDWSIQHIPELNYGLVDTGGTGGINGGIMKPQRGPWPGKLTFYIDVDDLDAYARKIKEAGGKIVVDKMDVPGVGQLLLFEDPEDGYSAFGSNRSSQPRERVPPARSLQLWGFGATVDRLPLIRAAAESMAG